MGNEERDYKRDEKLITENLKKIQSSQRVQTDEGLLYKSDTSSLSKHNTQYTTLLKAYVKDFKKNSKNKRKNKEDLFKIAKKLLIWTPIVSGFFILLTLGCLVFNLISVVETLPILFTSLTSLLGTFMVVPQMITKYLFNKKEEENLAAIISKIQKYDRDIRGDL
ncbi:hypothetical protein IMSAGC003_02949 [Lachnospiraceae bacterium]|nr:hypothetical protein IMSAGC003_02949 [Lachnospiraceae bacterium]